jgi:hypothetical protein
MKRDYDQDQGARNRLLRGIADNFRVIAEIAVTNGERNRRLMQRSAGKDSDILAGYVAEWGTLADVARLLGDALTLYSAAREAINAIRRRPITDYERETYADLHYALGDMRNALVQGAKRLGEAQSSAPDELKVQMAHLIDAIVRTSDVAVELSVLLRALLTGDRGRDRERT